VAQTSTGSETTYLPEEILKLLRTELTVGPEIAGKALGLGRSASYAACRTGDIPALRLGSKFVIPTSRLRQMLGIDPSPLPSPTTAALPTPEKVKPPRRQRRRGNHRIKQDGAP